MNRVFKRSLLALAVSTVMAAPALATNGYFAHGYSTESKGIAGAGAAKGLSSVSIADNPALAVELGNRVDVSAAFFVPVRSSDITQSTSTDPNAFALGAGDNESDNEFFLIPGFGYVTQLDDESAFAIAIYGNGGLNTEYEDANPAFGGALGDNVGLFGGGASLIPSAAPANGGTPPANPFVNSEAGVSLTQVFVNATYALKVNKTSSFGMSLIFAGQQFSATGLAQFAPFTQGFQQTLGGGGSLDQAFAAANITDQGTEKVYGFGAKIGYKTQIDKLHIGASYQSEIDMSRFNKYSGLFAEQGDFDIPATATIALAYDVSPSSTAYFDIQHIFYEDVAAIGNPAPTGSAQFQAGSQLGNDVGFGWDDVTVFKLGYEFTTNNSWTYRFGYSYAESPIEEEDVTLNTLATAVLEQHFTFGMTVPLSKDSSISLSALYAPENEVSGPNVLDPSQNIELSLEQYELQLGYTYKF